MQKKWITAILGICSCVAGWSQQNVGIGSTTPQYPLDVNGRMRLRYNAGTAGIWLNKADNSLASFVGQQNDTVFGIWHNDANSWRFGFDHKNIRLGIGTATPAYPLSFDNSLGDKISLFGGSINPVTNHYGFGIQGSLLQMFVPGSVDNIAFGTGRSASFTERMRITGAGKVGIGSTNPDYPLTVNTTIAGGGMVHTLVGANVSVGTFANASGGWLQTFTNHPLFLASFNGDAALTVATNKNIGIGTTTPSTTLDVNGTIRVRGGTPGAGQVLTSDVNGLASWEPVPQRALNAFVNAEQIIPKNQTIKLNFSTEPRFTPEINVNGFLNAFDNATAEFVVPPNQSGTYYIETDVNLIFTSNGVSIDALYRLNIINSRQSVPFPRLIGESVLYSTPNNRKWNIERVSTIVNLVEGDRVGIYVYHELGNFIQDDGVSVSVDTDANKTYLRVIRLY